MFMNHDFLRRLNISACRVVKTFCSKKNTVNLVMFVDESGHENHWVVKQFHDQGERIHKETTILEQMYMGGLAVPRLLFAEETFIVLEYIEGLTLLGWMEKLEHESINNDLQAEVFDRLAELALWFKQAYEILARSQGGPLILGDVNFRNFILGPAIHGIDFEDCRKGAIEEDIGRLCAFALTYRPAYTLWKRRFVDALKEAMGETLKIPLVSINKEMAKGIDELASRRKNP